MLCLFNTIKLHNECKNYRIVTFIYTLNKHFNKLGQNFTKNFQLHFHVFIMNCIKKIPSFRSNTLLEKYLIRRKILNDLKLQYLYSQSVLNEDIEVKDDHDFWKKVIYNEVFSKLKVKKPQKKNYDSTPIFLKYLVEDNNKVDGNASEEFEKNESEESSESVHFPYAIKKYNSLEKIFSPVINNYTPSDNEKIKQMEWGSENIKLDLRNLENPQKWASDLFSEGFENDNLEDTFKFGTYNPNLPVSSVPCGGCGALLHCNDPSIPGFIPTEVFEGKTKKELQAEICQRCHFLKEYDVSLGVKISPADYIKILSKIKEEEALAILMIDLLDFPCSIFPGILDIIGPTKPLVIVANKVDLLIQDGPLYLEQFKKSLLNELKVKGINLSNVKHISLISAKTGYGVEDLITQLHLNWGYKGDVYLIGCTNVGKSTLFNTLIQSDYCKVQATNILQRATISAWPGTTLNLLKFPILKPKQSVLFARLYRLKNQEKEEAALKRYQWLGQNIKLEQIPLQGHVGKSFAEPKTSESFELDDSLSGSKPEGLDPLAAEFRRGKWFYDTPGVVQEDQIVNLLTTSELLLTVPRKMLLPRNFHMKPGTSLFIGGIARLDYISGGDSLWFTVYSSMELPITVTKLEDADYVYKKLLGTPFFRVPMNGRERLAKWPEFSSKKFEVTTRSNKFTLKKHFSQQKLPLMNTSADVVLSSAGWIAVTVPIGYRCKIEAWTPEGRGIYLRSCPLIKNGFMFKGKKIPRTPAFTVQMKEVKGHSVTDEPPY